MFYGNPKVLSSTGTDNRTVNSAIANTQGLSNFFFLINCGLPHFLN